MTKNYNKDIFDWETFPNCDLIWIDPPWCENMVKWFQGKLKKDTGVIKSHTFVGIMTKFAITAKKNIPIVIEFSIKDHEQVIDIMQKHGHKFIQIHKGIQSNNRPFVLIVFNEEIKIDLTKPGKDIIINTLKNTKYNVIFDCFAGIGFTADGVRKAGKIYIGSEINKARYDRLCKVNI